MAEGIDKALEALDPSKYVVSLTKEERGAFFRVISEEQHILSTLKERGALVVHPVEDASRRISRRALVVVPKGVRLPSMAKLETEIGIWRAILEEAAIEQGKEPTVGSRGATMPVWIGPNGETLPLDSGKPAYVATKITTHLQRAYRGARMEPDEALAYLRQRLGNAQKSLAHSQKHYKHDRIPDQEEAIERIDASVAALIARISQKRIVSVRIFSGESWRVNIKHEAATFATTVATIALVPGTTETIIAKAHRRERMADDVEIERLAGGVELVIKRG